MRGASMGLVAMMLCLGVRGMQQPAVYACGGATAAGRAACHLDDQQLAKMGAARALFQSVLADSSLTSCAQAWGQFIPEAVSAYRMYGSPAWSSLTYTIQAAENQCIYAWSQITSRQAPSVLAGSATIRDVLHYAPGIALQPTITAVALTAALSRGDFTAVARLIHAPCADERRVDGDVGRVIHDWHISYIAPLLSLWC